MLNFLTEMKTAPKGEVWLHSSEWSKDWTCSFKGQINDLKVEISNTSETPVEAVDKTHATFRNLSNRVAAIQSPMIEHQPPNLPTPPSDDDIPF